MTYNCSVIIYFSNFSLSFFIPTGLVNNIYSLTLFIFPIPLSRHYLLFFATTAMNPRFMSTVDENLNPISASVRCVSRLCLAFTDVILIFFDTCLFHNSSALALSIFIYGIYFLSSPPLSLSLSISVCLSLPLYLTSSPSLYHSLSLPLQSRPGCGDRGSGR